MWFRQDLRIADHPALHAALAKGGPVIPVYIWAPEEEGEWPPGAASRWWLHKSLESLQNDLLDLGLTLILRQGASLDNLLQIAQSTGADAVFWHRRYEPAIINRDTKIKTALSQHSIKAHSANGTLLFEPWNILTKQNTPFKVFTPFWNCCLKTNGIVMPLPEIAMSTGPKSKIQSIPLEDFELLPKIHWDEGLAAAWQPGEKNAHRMLKVAIEKIVAGYPILRDRPDLDGVSKLSPYLHFGEITPRQIWHAVHQAFASDDDNASVYLKQIGWREFGHYLLYHFPSTPTEPLYDKFRDFPWKESKAFLNAWQKGQTGYPIVDAGMRQLWHTGWMHNRVRMIVASFLVKDLMLPWQHGAKWFWDTLVDADLANNTMGWQWTAGCGADAAPYFRVFNPITQGEKFDITRAYVRKWVPELCHVPDKFIYQPWMAPSVVLQKAGVTLGVNYPRPIVDHAVARLEALGAYHALSKQ